MKNFETIVKPVTTEKSSFEQSRGKYTFIVKRDATKIDVKHAVKAIYGADVKEVRMMVVPAKTRLIGKGKLWKKRPVFKKAIVSLKDKQTIDPNKITFKETKKK